MPGHKKKKKGSKKRYPVERMSRIRTFNPDGATFAGTLVPVSDNLSKINHRLYRQGMIYDVNVSLDVNATDTVEVYVLQDTWYTNNAWKLAYQAFLDNTALESDRKARWHDFRVMSGVDPAQFGEGRATAYPSGAGSILPPSGRYDAGEFVYSRIINNVGVANTFTWDAVGAGEIDMMTEYDRHGNTDADPESVVTDPPYAAFRTDIEAEQYEHMQDAGNEPPYNADGGFGTIWHKVATLKANSPNATKTSCNVSALCGLVLLVGYTQESVPTIQITAKPGNYKGVSAEPIGIAKKVSEHKFEVV